MVMDNRTELVFQQALGLSPDDRAVLAERLWDSLHRGVDPEVEQAWLDEINRRVAAYDRGEAQPVRLDEALQRIEAARK